ncbi:MAG: hypothetical protein ACOCOW_06195 [Prevotella sp.]|nr:hypothetical protein [Spirochaetales bacterium]MDY5500241.1 hypothetical protein [Sphaerochaetaceae bacterium]
MKAEQAIENSIKNLGSVAGATSDLRDGILTETLSDGDKLIEFLLAEKFDKDYVSSYVNSVVANKARIPYHAISEYVYQNQENQEKIDSLIYRIQAIKQDFQKDDSKSHQQMEILNKMLDHIKLASLQIQKFSEIINMQNEYMEKEKNDIENARHDNNAQVVSILSIFTAAAFVLFGGISGLSGLFGLLGNPLCPLGRIIIGVIVYGGMMLLVLLVLSRFIKRLVNSPKHQRK